MKDHPWHTDEFHLTRKQDRRVQNQKWKDECKVLEDGTPSQVDKQSSKQQPQMALMGMSPDERQGAADSQETFDECQAFHAQLVQQTVKKMQTFDEPQDFHRFLD